MARALRSIRRTIALAQPANGDTSIRAIQLSIRALSRLVEGVEETTAVASLKGSAKGFAEAPRGGPSAPEPELARAALLYAVEELHYLINDRPNT